jgi:chromosome segregation ATPase
MPLSTWQPLQSAAGAFRDECSQLDQLVQELFADLDRLGAELDAKADELEEGRRHLAERGRLLAEQRKESAQLTHQLEQQETRLGEALGELRELRAELANRPVGASAPQGSVLSPESLQGFSQQFAEQFALLKQQLCQSGPSAFVDVESLKQELLKQQEAQLTSALVELRELRAELANRPGSTPGDNLESAGLRQQVTELQVERAVLLERLEAAAKHPLPGGAPGLATEALESLNAQFLALQQQIQALQQDSPEVTELDALKKERQELELELELVRARSAELQETVGRQKRELAAQRLEVNEELKELRTLIAGQAELFTQNESEGGEEGDSHQVSPAKEKHVVPPVSGAAPVNEEPSGKPVDPVVNSVMAQFAKLQRDLAQRRKKK